MEKAYKIRRGTRPFFRSYIELLRPFLKGITNREADIFAELLYYNYLKSDVPNKQDRFALILNTEIRKEIEQELGISSAILRNALTSLRKKGLLKENNTISDAYLVPKKEKSITLKFTFILENS